MKVRYQLLDFGNGKKLETLGDYTIERPSPAAVGSTPRRRWPKVDAVFETGKRSWTVHRALPDKLTVDCGDFAMPAKLTPFGHLGIFPEQQSNWHWLGSFKDTNDDRDPQSPPAHDGVACDRALNLFGYTGASTVAMAIAGQPVVHVDAAKPNVESAKRSAALNDLSEHPIRYLVDDAAKFAGREVRRGRRYQTIVLDPPAYGHAKGGRTWRIERDLWGLIDDCLRLLVPGGRILVSGHTEGIGHPQIERYIRENGRSIRREIAWEKSTFQGGRMTIQSHCGRALDAGFFLRIETTSDTMTG